MILFPLTFLSNAFVPVETLPGWLQAFVKINPVSHIVTAVRDARQPRRRRRRGRLGAARLRCVVIAIFAPLSVRAYTRKLSDSAERRSEARRPGGRPVLSSIADARGSHGPPRARPGAPRSAVAAPRTS